MSFKGFVKTPPSLTITTSAASATWTSLGNIGNLWVAKPGSGDLISGRYGSAPSTPYTVIAHVTTNPTDTTGLTYGGGLGWANSSGEFMFLTLKSHANTYTSAWSVIFCSNNTTIHTTAAGYSYAYGFPHITNGWMAIRNDNTNIYFYIGDESGQNFYQIYSEAKNAKMASLGFIGIFTDAVGSSTNLTVDSFKVFNV